MSDEKKKGTLPEPTVITLVLPVDKTQPATVTVRNGELGHLSSFAYDTFKDICLALNAGMQAFVDVQANPPQNIPSAKPQKAKASKKAAGKPPYKLQDSKGNVRVLDKMFDPFELQDKYHKSNPKFKFDDLDEAIAVAQTLLDAGLEKQITITYSNGKAVQVLPEPEAKQGEADTPEPPSDPPDESETSVDEPDSSTSVEADTDETPTVVEDIDVTETTVVPDSDEADTDDDPATASVEDSNLPELDTDAKRAMFAVLHDEALTQTIYSAIQTNKKHGWKKNLIKQREVKGIIALYVDGKETQVEALYQIALDSFEFADEPQAKPTVTSSSAPVITMVLSPDLAKAKGVPEYQEFTLATSEDDEDIEELEAAPAGQPATLF